MVSSGRDTPDVGVTGCYGTSERAVIFPIHCFIAVLRRFYEGQVPGQACTGAVTVIQFCGQDLSLNVHFHSLVLEGGYTWDAASEQLCKAGAWIPGVGEP